ncbi:Tyrosine-protein kinase [Trema orientale]|uniref:Tyrosine-protein kinase n=1 Tax=Trema orientale TaxID=63057 RepID=A0A2P5FE29_TREOI|nr:Tyrosine-protein kinase [Trema orientale]
MLTITALIYTLFLSVSLSNPDITVLLSFKASSDRSNSLSSWVNSSGSDPCSDHWLGVTCDPESGRVTRLVLENLNLTGSARPLSQLVHLRHLSLKGNRISSSSLELSPWPNLKHLYLSHNRLAGKFPAGISSLRRLRRLDLSHNGFSGKIPLTELSRLPHLLTLRLESNSFDGELDAVESYPYAVSDFNVSENNLSGEIPFWLSMFPATSFAGNKLLCGHPLPYDCPNPTAQKKSGKNAVLLTTVVVTAAAGALAVVAVTVAWYYWHKRRNQKVTTFRTCDCARKQCRPHASHGGPSWSRSRESYDEAAAGMDVVAFEGCSKGIGGADDLLRASAEMLGKGSVGTTYKVVMDGGDTAAVKRVTEGRLGKEVEWWLRQVLGKLRHTNVVSLRAYHRSQNQELLLLVYDFLPNGSLHHLLHGNRGPGRTPLDWSTRLRLASDSARGIAFLHGNNKAKLFHGHLTSSNIVVDRFGNACVADAGLHQLLHVPLSPHSAYTAPELITLGNQNTITSPRKYTQKCDVYSFGVVLLEILTGKILQEGENRLSLEKWIQSMARKEWTTWEVLDIELLVYKDMEEEILALMQVALLCLAPSSKDRPMMSVVYRMIEDIRTKGVRDRETTSIMDDLVTNALSDASSA